MLRSGIRYFGASPGAAQRGRSHRSRMRCNVSRPLPLLSSARGGSNGVSVGLLPFRAPRSGATAVPRCLPHPLLPHVVGPGSNYGLFARSWSSGRMSADVEKQTESLADGDVTTVSPPKKEEAASRECEPLIPEALPQQPWRQRVKTFAIEYGRVGICTHMVLSMLSLSIIYAGVSSGVDVKAILDWLGFSTSASDSTANTAGTFIIAYTFYKVLTPVRWPLTFAVTPVVLRALRRRGYMLESNTPPSSPTPPPP